MPDLVAGASVECENLIGACDVHDAVGHNGHSFQPEVPHVFAIVRSIRKKLRPQRNGKGPLETELIHVARVDLFQIAVSISAQVPVPSQPVTGLWIENSGKINSTL